MDITIQLIQKLIGVYIFYEAFASFIWVKDKRWFCQLGRIVRMIISVFLVVVAYKVL